LAGHERPAPGMNPDLHSRTASIALTAALAALVTDYSQWVALVIGFGFAHYLLSFYYARAGIRSQLGDPALLLPLVSLCALLAVVYFLDFPLEIYFGVHHACNEGYLRRRSSRMTAYSTASLQGSRALFHLAAYFCILRFDAVVGQLPDAFLWSFLTVAAVLHAFQLLAAQRQPDNETAGLLRESAIELLLLLLVGLSIFTRVTFLQFVMYHFILWTLLPIAAIRQQGRSQLAEYGLLTVGALLFFIVLITNQLFSTYLNLSFYYSQFILWSYIHITTSFALSSAHPQWMVDLFRRHANANH
jgi:hypothetical protein